MQTGSASPKKEKCSRETRARQQMSAYIRDVNRPPARPGKIIVSADMTAWRHHSRRLNIPKRIKNDFSVTEQHWFRTFDSPIVHKTAAPSCDRYELYEL